MEAAMYTEKRKRPLLTDDGELIDPQYIGGSAPTIDNRAKNAEISQPEHNDSASVFWWTLWDSFGIMTPLLVLFLVILTPVAVLYLISVGSASLGIWPT